MLDIRPLGQFEVRLNGELVEIPSRPAQLLLAYLVLKPRDPPRLVARTEGLGEEHFQTD